MSSEPTSSDKVKIFNGAYTIRNKGTNEHRTFQIRTQPDDAKFAPGKRVLSLLTGPENMIDYQGFAFVTNEGIHVWKSKKGSAGKRSNFEWYASMLWELGTNPDSDWHKKYDLMAETRCCICNRRLTCPESITSGIGPVCASKGGF